MKVLAIDPASYKCGIALFQDGVLQGASTLIAEPKDRLRRMSIMIDKIGEAFNYYKPDVIVVEDPLLKGRGNVIMERLKGIIEASAEILVGWPKERSIADFIFYIPPTTVKKYMGAGTLDKLEVALAAGNFLNSEVEKELLADLIEAEDYDATDAIAIGLSYYLKYLPEGLQ